MKQQGIYNALIAQLNNLARHNRQGSFRTKERYYEAMQRFCRYLAEEFRLQKLTNISGKHLAAYILYLQENGKSASTIKTDLAAIRFFHDKMDAKYELPDNYELGITLERRCFGGVDRSWSNAAFNRLLAAALAEEHYDYILALYLARYAGLRIHECFRIDTAIAEHVMRGNPLTVKGKGGKVRTVPVNDAIMLALEKQLARTERGHKLLVPDGMPTDAAIHELQAFIRANRPEGENAQPLTFHGLRHTFAAETYQKLIEAGRTPLDAHYAVSRLLGHERADVTDIYLAGAKGVKAHE